MSSNWSYSAGGYSGGHCLRCCPTLDADCGLPMQAAATDSLGPKPCLQLLCPIHLLAGSLQHFRR
eukprot:3082019-Pyramimonas_sp.AAC.1